MRHFATKRRRIASPDVALVVKAAAPAVASVGKAVAPAVKAVAPTVKATAPFARRGKAPPQSSGWGRGRLAAARGHGPVIDLDDSDDEMPTVKAAEPAVQGAPMVAKTADPIIKAAPVVAKAIDPVRKAAPAVAKPKPPVVEIAEAAAQSADPAISASPAVAKAMDPVLRAAPAVAKPKPPPAVKAGPVVAKALGPVIRAAPAVAKGGDLVVEVAPPAAKAAEPAAKAVGVLPPAAFPAPVITHISVAEVTPFASALGMDVHLLGTAWTFKSKASGKPIGKVNVVGNGYKATCKRHADCSCHISCPPAANRSRFVFDDLMRWISTECSLEQHREQSQQLRVWKYQMKVRGP